MLSQLDHNRVQVEWKKLASSLSLSELHSNQIWNVIRMHYSEPLRKYHNLNHLDDILTLKEEFLNRINDNTTVSLAIFFHDIIYDPTSGKNEEDSSNLFQELFSQNDESIAITLTPEVIAKVSQYINDTKAHAVLESPDMDLKLFIDLDMSILGKSRETYINYANAIRLEYIHADDSTYCEKRAAFLEHTLANTSFIFATETFRGRYEASARENMTWECKQLKVGLIPLRADDED